jgi:hypothetical protein
MIFLSSVVCFSPSLLGHAAENDPQSQAVVQIETAVVAAVKNCGGKFIRDVPTGRIIEVDVAATRSSVDDATFSVVVQLEGLKKLSVSGGSLLEASLKKLETLVSLEELYLVDTVTSDTDLAELCKKLPKLKRLTLRRLAKLSNQGLESLRGLKELRNLSLLSLSISGPGLEMVAALPTLRALDLRGCNELAAEDYRLLVTMTSLTDLKIGGASINADVLRTVAALPNLTGLAVEDATVSAAIWDELFATSQWLDNMTSLAFARTYSVGDRVLEKLSGFKKLRTLSLRAVPVRGTFVENLAPDSRLFDTLQTLGMTKNYATKDEILSLARFRNLKKLDFSNTPLTLDKVEALSTLERLETLILKDCQLTEELFTKLVPLKNLSALDIVGNPALTDQSRETFERFPKLS